MATATGVERIAAERERQVNEEGWSLEHDVKEHSDGALSLAASYLASQRHPARQAYPMWVYPIFAKNQFNRVRELTIAGALIAAEIDRIQAGSLEPEYTCMGCGSTIPNPSLPCPCSYLPKAEVSL